MKKFLLVFTCLIVSLMMKAQTLPTGFFKTSIVTGLQFPVAFDVAPDGRYFITLKGGSTAGSCSNGKIMVYSSAGTLLSTFYNLTDSVQCDFERGLLGIAIDPNFSVNHYVYAYYNHKYAGDERIRVMRFTEVSNVGTAPVKLLDLDVSNTIPGNHVGGIIEFRPTEPTKLYVTIGDLARGQTLAQDTSLNYADTKNTPYGKILRINSDGTIPTDNPFYDDGNPATGNDDRIWSYGHRNMFGLAWSPLTDTMYLSENGYNRWDEVNVIHKGSHYGWISCEGKYKYNSATVLCNNPSFVDPIAEWAAPLPAITGIMYYSGSVIPSLDNHLLVADNDYGRIYNLTLGNAPAYDVVTSNVIWADLTSGTEGGLTTIKQGTDGCIYALNGGYISTGKIFRVCPVGVGINSNFKPENTLGQNYPNPMSGKSQIDFGVSDNSFVTLDIFDVTGRKLKILVNESVEPGNHTVEINDMDKFAEGNYYYKIEIKQNNKVVFSETKKMMLVK
ncbi:MAG: glucose/sorbosone dehydrogenase [Bacteroidetes bacterium]|nr:glucose/sorbosone dehydrogenase [Bacteroidota bacterium]